MKSKKSLFKILMLFFMFFLTMGISKVYAATCTFSPANVNVIVGESFTVTTNVNAGSWNLAISAPGLTAISDTSGLVGQTTITSNTNASKSYTFKANSEGSYKITLSGDISDFVTDEISKINKTINVVAKKAPVQQSTPTPTPKPTPTPVTLTFSNASGTMYTTGSVRFRSHYDTSNSKNIITTLEKGIEVTVTGKATGWYKVTYGGKTGYISSDYLTSTKPEKPEEPTTEPSTPPSTAPEEQKSNDSSLKSLSITGIEITPTFDATIFNYQANTLDTEITSVEVLAEVNDEKAKYEVIGNTDLKDGENIIAVAVTAEDGTVSKYEIKLIKGVIETASPEQTPVATPTTNQNSLSKKQIAIIAGIAGVTLLAITLLVRHYRKQNDLDYGETDYSFLKNDEEIQNKEIDKKQEFLNGFENNDNNNDDGKRKGGKHF